MIRSILFIVTILVSFNCFAQQKKTQFWKNGNKQSEGSYVDSLMTGKWIFWYDNGNKWSEGEYKKGKKIGKWQIWYDDGKKWKVSNLDCSQT